MCKVPRKKRYSEGTVKWNPDVGTRRGPRIRTLLRHGLCTVTGDLQKKHSTHTRVGPWSCILSSKHWHCQVVILELFEA
jgi:hypothetical protein